MALILEAKKTATAENIINTMNDTPLTAKAKIACGFQAVPQFFLEHAENLERENRILREALCEIKQETDVKRVVRIHYLAADTAYWIASDALKETRKEAQP